MEGKHFTKASTIGTWNPKQPLFWYGTNFRFCVRVQCHQNKYVKKPQMTFFLTWQSQTSSDTLRETNKMDGLTLEYWFPFGMPNFQGLCWFQAEWIFFDFYPLETCNFKAMSLWKSKNAVLAKKTQIIDAPIPPQKSTHTNSEKQQTPCCTCRWFEELCCQL